MENQVTLKFNVAPNEDIDKLEKSIIAFRSDKLKSINFKPALVKRGMFETSVFLEFSIVFSTGIGTGVAANAIYDLLTQSFKKGDSEKIYIENMEISILTVESIEECLKKLSED